MLPRKSFYFFLLFGFSLNIPIGAQQLISCASFSVSNNSGSFTGSMGESIISETSNQQSVHAGFQQAFIDMTTHTLPPAPVTDITIYPNPTSEKLTLSLDSEQAKNKTYILCDITGNTILEGKILSSQTQLDVSQLSPAIYLLKILQNNRATNLIKIIKR